MTTPSYSVLYVWKEPKNHGTGKLVEGVYARGTRWSFSKMW
jgi:orotate phosphoribosyltransferase